jgi:hypothetical protein
MAIISIEFLNGIEYHVVDHIPNRTSDTSRRLAEAAKEFMRKHPHPEIIEREDGSFDFVPYNRRISEKISSNSLGTDI